MSGLAPTCLSMLLCDAVHVDPTTNKATLLGTLAAVAATSFPASPRPLTVFVELNGGRGAVDLTLRVVRTSPEVLDGIEVWRTSFVIRFPDPLVVMRAVVSMTDLELPEPGEYRVILETGSRSYIADRRLLAMEIP